MRAVTRGEDASHSIVIVGSSQLSFWRSAWMTRDLGPLPLVNRAVPGWTTADVLHHENDLISLNSGAASVVVYYAGSNDLRRGGSPQDAASNVAAFAARLPPTTHLVIIASIISPDRMSWAEAVEDYNARLHSLCAADRERRAFVDANALLAGRRTHFRYDGLHLNELGYKELGNVLRPVLEDVWTRKSASTRTTAAPTPAAAAAPPAAAAPAPTAGPVADTGSSATTGPAPAAAPGSTVLATDAPQDVDGHTATVVPGPPVQDADAPAST